MNKFKATFIKKPPPRIGIFIDGSNLFATIKMLNILIDYAAVLKYFGKFGQIKKAMYYTAVRTVGGYAAIRPTLDYLATNGWVVVEKAASQFNNGRKTKGNMDVELTIDVLQAAPKLDEIYLFTGDGDFCRLVNAVQQLGVHVTIVSSMKTKDQILSHNLRRVADGFIELDEIRGYIQKDI